LSAKSFAGIVQLDSDPSGAEATTSLGGGCRTPCALEVSADGPFTVTFTHEGYAPATVQVKIQRARMGVSERQFAPNPVSAQLAPVPGPTPAQRAAKKPAATAQPPKAANSKPAAARQPAQATAPQRPVAAAQPTGVPAPAHAAQPAEAKPVSPVHSRWIDPTEEFAPGLAAQPTDTKPAVGLQAGPTSPPAQAAPAQTVWPDPAGGAGFITKGAAIVPAVPGNKPVRGSEAEKKKQ
jgi:hypothetical protein